MADRTKEMGKGIR